MKSVILLSLFFFGFCCADNYDFRMIDSIKQEQPCTSQGGTCTLAADCPAGRLVKQQGLCPKQRNRGVECCYGVSVKETRCRMHGGECMVGTNVCSPTVMFRAATDCPQDHTCCILVH